MTTTIVLAQTALTTGRERLGDTLTLLATRGFQVRRCSPLIELPRVFNLTPVDNSINVGHCALTLVVDTHFNGLDASAALASISEHASTVARAAQGDPPVTLRLLGHRAQDAHALCSIEPTDIAATTALRALYPRPQPCAQSSTLTSVPLWMAPVNVTPDSFSDAGEWIGERSLENKINALVAQGAHIIDVGGESVRPGARPVPVAQEWARIGPTLQQLLGMRDADPLFPQISVDTRHAVIAERALELGVDCINDVGGLTDKAMCTLARDSDATWFVMHSLVIPADPAISLPSSANAVACVCDWARERQADWHSRGIDLSRIVLDPGICFGKSRAQSQHLMQSIQALRAIGQRVLMGHSRKGFSQQVEQLKPGDRDPATVAASLAMAAQGVDMLRVHNVAMHQQAMMAYALTAGNA